MFIIYSGTLPFHCCFEVLFLFCGSISINFINFGQIYEKPILHVQIEQDVPYPVGRTATAGKSFFKYKLSKQMTYFAFKCYGNMTGRTEPRL